MIKENLVAYFYLLLRDHLVIGDAMLIRNEVLKITDQEKIYTNKHLEAIARELVDCLVDK